MPARTETSSIETGSSAIRSFGSSTSAAAIATRWRWPPESSCGIAVEEERRRRQPGALHRLAHLRLPLLLRPREPVHADRLLDRVADREAGVEGLVRILVDDLDLAPERPQRPRVEAAELGAAEANRAGVAVHHPDHGLRGARLAAARFAHERDHLPRADREGDAVDCAHRRARRRVRAPSIPRGIG